MIVRYSKLALSQLAAIYDYIEQDKPAAAQKVKRYIQDAVDQLTDLPRLGRATGKPGVYRLVLASYPCRIYYKLGKDEVIILRIRYGAQDN